MNQNSKQTYQQVPKEEQNFKCYSCGEPVYFKRGFKDARGKAQRFNKTNDQAHVCNPEQVEQNSATAHRRRQKAYWARRNSGQSYRQRRTYEYNDPREGTNERREYRQQEEQKSRVPYEPTGMTRSKAIYVLKLNENFTSEELEAAKRTQWLKFHPDRNHGVGAAELFREVTDAYEYLMRFN
jgi:hypothetical protein